MIRRDNDYYIVLPKWVVHHFVASLMERVLIHPWVLGCLILQQNHTCVVQKMPELLWLLILRPHPKTGYTFRVCKTRERPKFWPKPMVFNIAVFNLICWVDHLFFLGQFHPVSIAILLSLPEGSSLVDQHSVGWWSHWRLRWAAGPLWQYLHILGILPLGFREGHNGTSGDFCTPKPAFGDDL